MAGNIGIGGVNKSLSGGIITIGGVNKSLSAGYAGIAGVNRNVFDTKTYLYNNGDECTALTGGWGVWCPYGSIVSFTRNASNFVFFIAKNKGVGGFCTTNTINTTGYSKLCMKYSIIAPQAKSFGMATAKDSFKFVSGMYIDLPSSGTMITSTVNFTGTNGSYYVSSEFNTLMGDVTVTVYQIWLE